MIARLVRLARGTRVHPLQKHVEVILDGRLIHEALQRHLGRQRPISDDQGQK